MDGVLSAIEATELALALRFSRWGYATVNATHILAIGLVFGATLPLNLRLLGLWPGIPRAQVARLLSPVAGAGLALAAVTGAMLFSVRATEYATLEIMLLKLALVATGTVSALLAHYRYGWALEQAGRRALAIHAIVSLVCWTGAIYCGRLIAFIAD